MLTRRKIAIAIVALLAVGAVFFLTRQDGQDYILEAAGPADITEFVDESGIVKISGQIDVHSPTNGVVSEIYVANGDEVKVGQDLFKVVSSATAQEKQQAYATYLAAQSAVKLAESRLDALQADMFAKWEAYKRLAETDQYEDHQGRPIEYNRDTAEFLISERSWSAAEKQYTDQQTAIAQAKSAASAAWLVYQATQTATVKATANGKIANLSVQINDSISHQSVRPILTIADFTSAGVLLAVTESDVVKVNPGDQVQIQIDAIRNRQYQGSVARVDEIGYNDGGQIKFDVFVEISDRDEQIKAGMTADVQITTSQLTGVLSVPNSAIKPYQGGRAVQVVGDDGLEFMPVVVGIRGQSRTQIISGVEPGQQVVVSLTNEQVGRRGLFGN